MIVLDTHIWIWLVNGNFDRFPASWLPQIIGTDRLGEKLVRSALQILKDKEQGQ